MAHRPVACDGNSVDLDEDRGAPFGVPIEKAMKYKPKVPTELLNLRHMRCYPLSDWRCCRCFHLLPKDGSAVLSRIGYSTFPLFQRAIVDPPIGHIILVPSQMGQRTALLTGDDSEEARLRP